MQHWKPGAMSAELRSVVPHYQTALDAARRAQAASITAGRKYVDYWIGRLEFGIAYMQAIEAVRAAATAEESHDRAGASREAQRAVDVVRQALASYARVANDRSDRGAIAVMNEYVYRPLQAKASRLP